MIHTMSQSLLLNIALGGIAYVLVSRLSNQRPVAREPNLYENPEKGMSSQSVYESFRNPTQGAGLQNPTIQPGGDLNELIAKYSWDAAEGDTAAQQWLVDHNMRRGLHVGGSAITGHLGIGRSETSHLVAGK